MKNLIFIFSAIILFSCGAEKTNNRTPLMQNTDTVVEDTDKEFYMLGPYQLSDKECSIDKSLDSLGEQKVWFWNGENIVSENISYTESIGEMPISGFQFGMHKRRLVKCNNTCDKKSYSRSLEQKPKDLFFCKNSYPKDSIEGIALTILKSISTSANYHKKINNQLLLPKVEINILPAYETIYEDVFVDGVVKDISVVRTSNASWQLFSNGFGEERMMIDFLPDPKGTTVSKDESIDLKLWEIPLVGAHEYGHHIFYEYAPKFLQASSLNFISEGFQDEVNGDEVWLSFNLLSNSEIVNANIIKQEIIAIAEAASDLFADYTFSGQESYFNIKCMELNRDVISNRFADGTSKILDLNKYEIFIRKTWAEKNRNCDKPDFLGAYNIASIVSYGLNQIFSSASGNDFEVKGKMLISWLKKLELSHNSLANQEIGSYLKTSISLAIETTIEFHGLKKIVCQKARESFPYFLAQDSFSTCL